MLVSKKLLYAEQEELTNISIRSAPDWRKDGILSTQIFEYLMQSIGFIV